MAILTGTIIGHAPTDRRCVRSPIYAGWTAYCRTSTSPEATRRARTMAANQKTCAHSSRTRRQSTPRGAASSITCDGSPTRSNRSITRSSLQKTASRRSASSAPTCMTNFSSSKRYAAASKTRSFSRQTSTHATCMLTRRTGRATSWSRPTSTYRCARRCSTRLSRSGTVTKLRPTSLC